MKGSRWIIVGLGLALLLAAGALAYWKHRRTLWHEAVDAEKAKPSQPAELDRTAAGLLPVANEAAVRVAIAPPPANTPQPAGNVPALPASPREPPVLQAEALKVETRADGVLAWEAEWANRVLGSWEVLPVKEASGGAALWARHGSGRSIYAPFQPDARSPLDLGIADYVFNVPKSGKYRLFLRTWAPDGCGDSCWVNVDRTEDAYKFDQDDEPLPIYGRWFWMPGDLRTYRLSAGPHLLHLEVREEGLVIDQIAFVPDGVARPEGTLAPSLAPGAGAWPADFPVSAESMTSRAGHHATPFDAALMAENYVLAPEPDGTGHTATLWLWVRLNGPDARRVRIEITAPEAEVRPAQTVSVALSSGAPLARVRFVLHYPPATPRRGYDVRAAVTCPGVPGLKIERRVTVLRPFDWRALGPLTRAQEEAAGMALKDLRQFDFAKPLTDKTPLPAWTAVVAPSHYDCFGTLDFCLLWGEKERTAAFAVMKIHAARDGTYRLLTGADDDLRLRLDGKPILDLPPHYLRPLVDTLRFHDLPLTAGDHLLVGRVRQDIKFWQVRVQFYGTDNLPTPDVWGLGAEE